MTSIAFILVVLAALAGVIVLPQAATLVTTRWGRITVLGAAFVLPSLAVWKGATHSLKQSSQTNFCLSCHEMGPYGDSMRVDDREILAAAHFQNKLVDRTTACFTCHRDYALFGDVTTKFNGMRHVVRHYLGGVPEKLELYQPYPNANCLSCHRGARSFEESSHHNDDEIKLPEILSGAVSCLDSGCHDVAHAVDELEDADFWQEKVQ